jgi:hypothetical protein
MKNTWSLRSGPSAVAAPLLLGLPLLALASCESITGVAPKGTPRVEIELAVTVDDGFVTPLVGVNKNSPLYAAVKDAVRDKADLGLRFYPTPSERYGADDVRPEYVMTVQLERLSFEFDHEQIETEGQAPRIVSTVKRVRAEVQVAIERRRTNAPELTVATARASSAVSAAADKEDLAAADGYTLMYDEQTLKVLQDDIVRAVESSVGKALNSMRTPIDREFASDAE